MRILRPRYEQEAVKGEVPGGMTSQPAPETPPAVSETTEPPAAPPSPETPPDSALPAGGLGPEGAPPSALPNTESWRDVLPEQLRENPSLSKFESPEALATSYLNLESQRGTSIRIPGEDASPEARKEFLDKLVKNAPELMVRPEAENMDEFYATLGRPDDPEKYTAPTLEGAPENLDMSEADVFRQIAYEAGLTDKQYQHVVRSMAEGRMIAMAAMDQDFSAQVKELRQQWGDAYDGRYRSAYQIAQQLKAPENVLEGFRTGYIQPENIEFFYNLKAMIGSEGNELGQQGDTITSGTAPDEAQAQIDEIMANKEHPYWQAHHPDHQKALDKMVKLQTMASPGAETNLDRFRA